MMESKVLGNEVKLQWHSSLTCDTYTENHKQDQTENNK